MNASELLTALRSDAKHFGPLLAERAYTKGLAVTNRADGTTKPIPVTATPVIVSSPELDRRLRLSALLSSAGAKMAFALLSGPAKRRCADEIFVLAIDNGVVLGRIVPAVHSLDDTAR